VVDNGVVVGIVTNRDTRFETNLDQPVRNIMTPRDRLVTVSEGSSPEEAKALMHKHRLERVLVVNADFQLRGLVTVKDILKSSEHPFACKDEQGHLRVGAAVGVGEGTEERVELLAEAGVDVIVVDTAHGHSEGVLKRVQWVKKNFPQVEVIGGNIATAMRRRRWSITAPTASRSASAPARSAPRASSPVSACRRSRPWKWWRQCAGRSGVPLIADGGIRYSGDISKAIAAGANAVMLGGLFAGTEEAPGETVLYQGAPTRPIAAWAASAR
jgi:IMP dehydrogenase